LARFFKPDISLNQAFKPGLEPGALLSLPENQSCKFLHCGGMENKAWRQRPFAKIVI
jgi:hypothetical protein